MKKPIDLSIGQRLGIGFSLILVVLGGLIAAMYYWNTQSERAERAFAERIVPLTYASDELQRNVLRVAITVRAYLLRADTQRLQRYASTEDSVRNALDRLAALPKETDGEQLYRTMRPRVERYLAEAATLVRQPDPGVRNRPEAEARLADTREEALASLEAFAGLQLGKADAAMQAIHGARQGGARGLAIATLLALGLFAVTTLLIVRAIRNPVRELLAMAGAMQRGEWRQALALAPASSRAAEAQSEMTRLAQAFAIAASALEGREQRLRVDREIAGASASSLLKEEIAQASLRAIGDHLNAEIGVMYWMDEASNMLAPMAVRGLDAQAAVPAADGIPGQALRERRIVVVSDIPPDTPFRVKLGYDSAPPRSVAAVPIRFRDSDLGVLVVGLLRELGPDHAEFLEDAAKRLGIGLQNVKTYERVQALLAELEQRNHQVQAQNEELQAQNEELQAQGEEIQAQNEELQAQGEEIRAQNDQLKDQADRLRDHALSLVEADRRKSEFLGVLAHELRNPMAAISSSLTSLAHAASTTDHRARALGIMDRQTRMLARLVDDLLDVTRISSGKIALQFEELDLTAIVRECAEDYRDHAAREGVKLDVEVPDLAVLVRGDRTRLCQVVGNLVDNAIKFCNGTKRVRVSLQAGADHAELRVRDSGIGIDAHMIDRLFQPFNQADTGLAHGKGGLGLGLAIAKSLTEMQGGRIEARSDGVGKGSEFIITLPLMGRRPAAPDAQAAPAAAGRGRRILIIEDNPDAAHSLRDAMELAGHEVRVALEALEGIAIAREFHPEVLLCDIGLPVMDGYQVAETFRSEELLRSTFLIAVTGYAAPEDRERALKSGFDRHIGKPADIEKLHKLLSQAAPPDKAR